MNRPYSVIGTVLGLLFLIVALGFLLYSLNYRYDSIRLDVISPIIFIALGGLGLALSNRYEKPRKKGH